MQREMKDVSYVTEDGEIKIGRSYITPDSIGNCVPDFIRRLSTRVHGLYIAVVCGATLYLFSYLDKPMKRVCMIELACPCVQVVTRYHTINLTLANGVVEQYKITINSCVVEQHNVNLKLEFSLEGAHMFSQDGRYCLSNSLDRVIRYPKNTLSAILPHPHHGVSHIFEAGSCDGYGDTIGLCIDNTIYFYELEGKLSRLMYTTPLDSRVVLVDVTMYSIIIYTESGYVYRLGLLCTPDDMKTILGGEHGRIVCTSIMTHVHSCLLCCVTDKRRVIYTNEDDGICSSKLAVIRQQSQAFDQQPRYSSLVKSSRK